MEIKKETPAERFKKNLDYQKNQLSEDFKNAITTRDVETVINLIVTYPTFHFEIKNAVSMIGSIEDQDKAIEFLELLYIHPYFRHSDFFETFQIAIDTTVKNYQQNVVTFLLKKQQDYLVKHTPRNYAPTLTNSISPVNFEELKPDIQQLYELNPILFSRNTDLDKHLNRKIAPPYYNFLDTLVCTLLKEDPKLLSLFDIELINRYKTREENARPDILWLLLENFYFSKDNKRGLSLVNSMLPWAVTNGHAQIVLLFSRDETIPRHYINYAITIALNTGQTSILVLLALEKYWPLIRVLLLSEFNEDIRNYILGRFFFSPDYQSDLFFLTKENTVETNPVDHLRSIDDFLCNELSRLKKNYNLTNNFNNFLHMIRRQGIQSDRYGNFETDYLKTKQLQYIQMYIDSNFASLTSGDIPTIITLIHAVCAVKNHVLSGAPTSLTNFIQFCNNNGFTCPTDALLSKQRLLELFNTESDLPKVLGEINQIILSPSRDLSNRGTSFT